MLFLWFMLICDLIVPIVMIIAGRMMWKHCPKSINGIVGYRIWIHGNLHTNIAENFGGR